MENHGKSLYSIGKSTINGHYPLQTLVICYVTDGGPEMFNSRRKFLTLDELNDVLRRWGDALGPVFPGWLKVVHQDINIYIYIIIYILLYS